MGQIMAVIVIMVTIIFVFVPISYLNASNMETEKVKQSLNLAAKAVVNCVEQDISNLDEVMNGYERIDAIDIKIDKERLLKEFKQVIESNCFNQKEKIKKIEDSILAKALVYHDMFFVADKTDNWSPPFFFTTVRAGKLLYLNTSNDLVAYYDSAGDLKTENISNYSITRKEKNEIIINKINQWVAQYTYELGERRGLNIQIRNPYEHDIEYKIKTSHLNVLDGITFFVVYAENNFLTMNMQEFNFKDYNVVGYTIE